MSFALDLLLFATGWGHVLLAPYTKVEESFNLHATHDVLMHGVHPAATASYDHNVFPGAVPRTFIGSVLLAWLSQLAINLMSRFDFVQSKFDLQIIVRLTLASVNAIGLILLRRAVSHRFGRLTGFLWVILTCTQFHLPFWMGRTLPNMFALFPVNVAFYFLLDRAPNARKPTPSNVCKAIALLTFAGVVFRSEIALLLAPVVLQSFRLVSPYSVIKTGFASALISIALTVAADSYFWSNFPLWPELSGVYFNVYQGKSSEWGVSPFHTYFVTYLPKLLLSSTPLAVLGSLTDSRIRSILLSTLAFITLISGLGHKEWRFIIYTVPIFNIAAARGARFLVTRPKNALFGRLAFLLFTALLSGNCLFTYLSTTASIANYPGGSALALFNTKYDNLDTVHVHISNLAAQSGASLFLHTHAPPVYTAHASAPLLPHWTYNKTENLPVVVPPHFTHLIAEYPSLNNYPAAEWTVEECIPGFDGWSLDFRLLKNPQAAKIDPLGYFSDLVQNTIQMRTSPKLCILERKSR